MFATLLNDTLVLFLSTKLKKFAFDARREQYTKLKNIRIASYFDFLVIYKICCVKLRQIFCPTEEQI